MIFIIKPLKMSKKLIITEDQYNRLLLAINEANKKTPNTTPTNSSLDKKADKHRNMQDIMFSVNKTNSLSLKLVDDVAIKLCLLDVNGDNYKFICNDIKGEGKLTFLEGMIIIINKSQTEMKDVNPNDKFFKVDITYYRKNTKLGTKLELHFSNINIGKACDLSSEEKSKSKPVDDKPNLSGDTETKLSGDTKNNTSDEEIDIINAKEAYKLILGDKKLQQAFYKAPSLWNLFLSELKGKKAPGTGIVPTLQLVGDYQNKKITEALGARFIPGKNIVFYFNDNKKYIQGTVIEDKKPHLGRVYLEYTGNDGDKYTINVKTKIKNTNSSFNCTIAKPGKTEVRQVKITIIENQSKESYIPNS